MTAAEIIRQKMAERGIRQIDLLDIFGSRGRISEIVNGKRGVPKSKAVALSKRLRIPLRVLISNGE